MRLKCINEKGEYFPWMYRAYNAASGPDGEFAYEDPFVAFEKTYNGRFTYQWDGRVKEFYFNDDAEATLFVLRFM